MPVGVARLAAGSVAANPVGSHNETRLAYIYNDNEPEIYAVVKALPVKQLANELVAAAFLEALGLRCPRGYLVLADDEDGFSETAPMHTSGLRMYFGSAFLEAPIFLQRYQQDAQGAIAEILNYPEWGDIIGFDEWVANVDRHAHNLLFDGKNFIMFDHDRCLSGLNWNIADWVASKSYVPHPFIPAINEMMPQQLRENAAKRAVQLGLSAAKIDVEATLKGSMIEELSGEMAAAFAPMRDFLATRATHIAKLSGARLNVGGLV